MEFALQNMMVKALLTRQKDKASIKIIHRIVLEVETQEKWDNLFKLDPQSFCMTPKKFKSHSMCIAAVKHNLSFFKHVPNKHMTPDICEDIIKKKLAYIYLIPNEYKTKTMCTYAATKSPSLILYEGGIPLTLREQWMYDKLIYCNPHYLDRIPEVYISPIMIRNLEYCTDDYCTDECSVAGRIQKIIANRRKNIIFNRQIHQELYPIAWAPYRIRDWCLDTDRQKRIKNVFI